MPGNALECNILLGGRAGTWALSTPQGLGLGMTGEDKKTS